MKRTITQLVLSAIFLISSLTIPLSLRARQLQSSIKKESYNNSKLRLISLNPLGNTKVVAKDIKGKEYDIDAILKSGKFIMIDFSTVWCLPCWQVHRSGILERLYSKFGPKGSNEIELFWAGGDNWCTRDRIHGNGRNTKGDWTKDSEGNPVPYPIFAAPFLLHQEIGIPLFEYPSFRLITPNGKWIDCKREVIVYDAEFKAFKKLLDDIKKQETSIDTILRKQQSSSKIVCYNQALHFTEPTTGVLDLYDLEGRLLCHYNLKETSKVEIGILPQGTYIAKLFANGKDISVRFILK